ncbi:MAG TPA: helix-turn-helix domain-containing protein [Terriglobales bacterium]|nr:helix-turn-helix domain-containing protein [Terriglobales bacterium]
MPIGEDQKHSKLLNRAARERALIEAAGKLFAQRGYEATTTREIAKAAGCAEGLISRYFRGKAGLLVALIRAHLTEEAAELNAELPPAKTLEEEVQQLVDWDVERMWEEREFLKVIVPQVILNPDVAAEVIRMGPVRRIQIITERLKKYEQAQALPPEEITAVAEAVGALGLVFGFMNPTARVSERPRAKATSRVLARMLARALTKG